MKEKWYRLFGPGFVITAAFIGPGTVTTCTLAGANFGYVLLWAMIFAILATFVLQEMSGRLGLVGGMSLGEALYRELPGKMLRIVSVVMVVSAIGIGNAAYQTGNILGASLGLGALFGTGIWWWPLIIGGCAFVLLWFGTYKHLERIFVGFVVLMSVCFIATAVIMKPDVKQLLQGAFIPRVDEKSLIIALGLIGTTIVPYNIFLYALIVREKWRGIADLGIARIDMLVAVVIGGIISMAIIVTASAAFYGTGAVITDAGDMAVQLKPLLGSWAKVAVAVGLFGAGMSSAMTAPLAAGYAIIGTFKGDVGLRDRWFRFVWCFVLVFGVVFASVGLKPVPAILFAQVANGILLPVVALFLVYIMNNKRLLKEYVNSVWANSAGVIIIIIAFILGIWSLVKFFKALSAGG
jgi:NRAMP (natural resistance-associated macrophage protein)-like metal ion transporter